MNNKYQFKTKLTNGYTVSTVKLGRGEWETMVFDANMEEIVCDTNHYKIEAQHSHSYYVAKYC